MRKSMKVFTLFALVLLFATTYAAAAPQIAGLDGTKTPKLDLRVINGVFVAETGERTEFNVGNGDRVSLKNEALGLSYVLTATLVEGNRVAVTLEQVEGEIEKGYSVLDVQEMILDFSNEPTETLAPFKLGFTGFSMDRQVAPDDPNTLTEKTHIGCCVTCGGWLICCFPAHGYCCSISTSCGNGCSICVIPV